MIVRLLKRISSLLCSYIGTSSFPISIERMNTLLLSDKPLGALASWISESTTHQTLAKRVSFVQDVYRKTLIFESYITSLIFLLLYNDEVNLSLNLMFLEEKESISKRDSTNGNGNDDYNGLYRGTAIPYIRLTNEFFNGNDDENGLYRGTAISIEPEAVTPTTEAVAEATIEAVAEATIEPEAVAEATIEAVTPTTEAVAEATIEAVAEATIEAVTPTTEAVTPTTEAVTPTTEAEDIEFYDSIDEESDIFAGEITEEEISQAMKESVEEYFIRDFYGERFSRSTFNSKRPKMFSLAELEKDTFTFECSSIEELTVLDIFTQLNDLVQERQNYGYTSTEYVNFLKQLCYLLSRLKTFKFYLSFYVPNIENIYFDSWGFDSAKRQIYLNSVSLKSFRIDQIGHIRVQFDPSDLLGNKPEILND